MLLKIHDVSKYNHLNPAGASEAEPVAADLESGCLTWRIEIENEVGWAVIGRLSGGTPNGPAWKALTIRCEYSTAPKGIRFAIGVGRLFSVDSRCAELCNCGFWPAEIDLGAVLGAHGP
jgi:hypothetical protein